jgi:hypothetical protein
MAIGNILGKIGQGVATGARVVGDVAAPLGKAVANEEAGYAPQIAQEQREHQQKMQDAALDVQSKALEQQLEYGQKYGTLTPQQQQEYVDKITGLYSHPRHAATLMEKLRKAIHPNGAYAQAPQPPLPMGIPAGGTNAADERGKLTSLTDEDELKKQQALGSVDWFKKNMLPMFPADQQANKLNEYIDHINGITQGIPKPPKGFKPIEQNGIAAGLTDEDTGKQYTAADLSAAGSAPPEAKKFWSGISDAEAKKAADEERKAEEAEKRQERAFSHAFAMQESSIRNAITKGDYDAARKEVNKSDESYQAALDRASTMDKAAIKAKQGDQQAMFAVLSNHIAMTLQQPQVSARPTKAMFDEAANSLPWMQKIGKQFDSDGYLVGITLSPDQIDKMVDLGHQKAETEKEHVDRVRAEFSDDLNPTDSQGKTIKKTGAKRVGSMLPKTGAAPKGTVSLAKARNLPQYKGKSDADITAAAKALGYTVKP